MSSPLDSDATLPHLLAARAHQTPDDVALVDAETGALVTARELYDEIRACARRLSGAGIRSGDNVATMFGPSFAAYYTWLGLSGPQAVEVPVNPQLRGRTLAHLLNHSGARILIVEIDALKYVARIASTLENLHTVVVVDAASPIQAVPELPFRILFSGDFLAGERDAPFSLAHRHNTACIIYTSGTTGPPKGVVIPWGWMSTSNHHLPAGITGGARYSYLSPAHMSGKGALNNATAERRTLVLRQTFSVRRFWEDIHAYDCSVTQLFPPTVRYLLANPASEQDRSTPLQHVWIAPLIPEVRDFMERFDVAVTTGYGMTEIGGPIAGLEVDANNLMTSGKVNPDPRGYEVRIVDEHDRELPPGQVGELIVRASTPWTLNAGYYRDPQATADAWRNGWFHTGDALMKDEEGNFYFVDRYKDCIRRRGENISSFEVEGYMLDYPGVADAAAVGVPSADGEQEVKVFLVESDHSQLDLDALGAWLADTMPKFMLPRYLEVVPELFPRTPATGRVQKGVLRDLKPGEGQWDRLANADALERHGSRA